ncbi:MAG: DNA-directed RNA polymerase subunit beta', partial [Clostridia bacterium]|nr:DNA-directed RNA polymerase subunit beta' [Clostridia bacterium]
DMLKGKQGRFRQNLLGKRVDYSGRSVIVVGPSLKMYQCGLPKEMALELFKPFVIERLVAKGLATNVKNAKRLVERLSGEVWDVLEEVIRDHPVMLNRAPTLHRLGIQAFEPILVEGKALKLHPLCCTAFNADFDGDQMAVHVPLSAEAQAEARFLMLSANNLLKPADGRPVTVPTQDMVLGCYYLTITREEEGTGKIFGSVDEVVLAYDNGIIGIHSPIKVRRTGIFEGEERSYLVDCTMGQIIFNEKIPQSLGYVDRKDPNHFLDLEITNPCDKGLLGKILGKCIDKFGFARTAEVLDNVKALGFKYSTKGALTFSVSDIVVPDAKKELVEATEKKVTRLENQYKRGFITNDERKRLTIQEWEKTTDAVKDALNEAYDSFNPIWMMMKSGARGSMNQLRQLAGMRGNIANTAGQTIEIPIKANYREGLNVLEYFIASRGARKGLADTALRTADSGYLTRRLVDVAQSVIIREEDCGCHHGIEVAEIADTKSIIEPFKDRLVGRYPVNDVLDPETGAVLVSKDKMMSGDDADKIIAKGITKVEIRSILTCRSKVGVCAKCYGSNLATGEPIGIGESVGIIAAQSIGEPGTQLTMRTFHTGGIAGHDAQDITQGLPRVEELFEARKPKRTAILADIGGVVQIRETKKPTMRDIVITDAEGGETRVYQVPVSAGIKVTDGEVIEKGRELTEGAFAPQDILRTRGPEAVQAYIIQEVQRAYRQQGVDINDKHVEVVIRQMMNKVRIEKNGASDLLIGSSADKNEVLYLNEDIQARIDAGEKNEDGSDLELVEYTQTLLGITKASLATDSFLSAASFQETTRVLTEAAIRGKVDPLIGLKENVIIGKLIPAGSSLKCYPPEDDEEEEENKPQEASAESGEDTLSFDDDGDEGDEALAENTEFEGGDDDFDVQNAEIDE